MSNTNQYSVIPLRGAVVFPYMIVPIFVGRNRSIKALQIAETTDRKLFLTLQKEASTEDPTINDLNEYGIIADILQILKVPDGTVKVLVEGKTRARITGLRLEDDCFFADVEIPETPEENVEQIEAARKSLMKAFETYIGMTKRINSEVFKNIMATEDAERFSYMAVANIPLKINDLQNLLNIDSTAKRMEKIIELIETEIEVLRLDDRIKQRVKTQMTKSQKEYYLNEQMKAIQKEIGKEDEYKADIDEISQKLSSLALPRAVKDKADKELKKMKLMPPMGAETTVVRNYLDWIASLPWGVYTKDSLDLTKAEKILNKDHFGLEKPKERILEYLAVLKLSNNMKGPILCFAGPPGVGKTSLARSIATAMGRKFVRASMGGVRDEAEIRGHRRTYIGSLPGKIIQSIKKAGSMNPVFLLDEIDKLGSDYRGDPSSALLEALDPEQNKTFSDHYLEIEFDLSHVFFITTANSLDTIPAPLRDRMEIIPLQSYTEQEKLNIAMQFIIPKQMQEHHATTLNINITEKAILEIIRYYTKEAGVRNLERTIASLIRKSIRKLSKDIALDSAKHEEVANNDNTYTQTQDENILDNSSESVDIADTSSETNSDTDDATISLNETKGKNTASNFDTKGIEITSKIVAEYLGPRKFSMGGVYEDAEIGVATGLAWTPYGGDLLQIEVALFDGSGKLMVTGHLGDVMQESAKIAYSVAKSMATKMGVPAYRYKDFDVHLHVPEGAVPKDGPSAGITMASAILSAIAEKKVNCKIAMTGEITLRGKVLEIGGLKEKVLAAHRAGIKTIIAPLDNKKDLTEIPEDVKKKVKFKFVSTFEEVCDLVLS